MSTDKTADAVEQVERVALAMFEAENLVDGNEIMGWEGQPPIYKRRMLVMAAAAMQVCSREDVEAARLRSINKDLYEALENIMITCSDSTINADELADDIERARDALSKAGGVATTTEGEG